MDGVLGAQYQHDNGAVGRSGSWGAGCGRSGRDHHRGRRDDRGGLRPVDARPRQRRLRPRRRGRRAQHRRARASAGSRAPAVAIVVHFTKVGGRVDGWSVYVNIVFAELSRQVTDKLRYLEIIGRKEGASSLM